MSNRKFSKPPVMTDAEREKKLDAFVSASYEEKIIKKTEPKIEVTNNTSEVRKTKKDQTKPVLLRLPEPILLDLKEVSAFTGLSLNSVCCELLRIGVKEKIKEIKS